MVVASQVGYTLEPDTYILPSKEPAKVDDGLLHLQLDHYFHTVVAPFVHMMAALAFLLSPEHYKPDSCFAWFWYIRVGQRRDRWVDQVIEDSD